MKTQTYKNLLAALAGLTVLSLAGTSVSAATLYDNGALITGNVPGAFTDSATVGDPNGSMFGTVFQVPSTPGFATTATVGSINFGGLFLTNGAPTAGDTFTISFYQVGSSTGNPNLSTTILSTTLTNLNYSPYTDGSHHPGFNFYGISGQFEQTLNLTVGDYYYIGISDGLPGAGFATGESDYNTLGVSSVSYTRQGDVFYNTQTDLGDESYTAAMAFTLFVAPEPSVWTLLIVGGIGLLAARKFRHQLFRFKR